MALVNLTRYVTRALHDEFPELAIYTEHQAQNLELPCFMVEVVTDWLAAGFDRRGIYHASFAVTHCLPVAETAVIARHNEVSPRLYAALRLIDTEPGADPIRADNQQSAVTNGELRHTFDIAVPVRWRATSGAEPTIVGLELDINVKTKTESQIRS